MRIVLAYAALSLLTAAIPAAAQDKVTPPVSPPSACYDVSQPQKDMAPLVPILIDHCTGATWLLVRLPLPDAAGQAQGRYIYRWFPISVQNEEAELHLSVPPPVQQLPPARKP